MESGDFAFSFKQADQNSGSFADDAAISGPTDELDKTKFADLESSGLPTNHPLSDLPEDSAGLETDSQQMADDQNGGDAATNAGSSTVSRESVANDELLDFDRHRDRSPVKVGNLVLQSIQKMKKKEGSTIREIKKYLHDNSDVSVKLLDNDIRDFLQLATDNGTLSKAYGGKYSISKDNSADTTVPKKPAVKGANKRTQKSKLTVPPVVYIVTRSMAARAREAEEARAREMSESEAAPTGQEDTELGHMMEGLEASG